MSVCAIFFFRSEAQNVWLCPGSATGGSSDLKKIKLVRPTSGKARYWAVGHKEVEQMMGLDQRFKRSK
jgi:hypothetical protein